MASISSSGIRSPQLNWDQLKTSFVSTYWSTGVLNSSRAFLHVFQWLSPQSHAMNASRDALCLIHLGTRHKDQRLLLEGRTRHLAALKCMQEEVQKPNAAMDDCILGAAYTLGHCEVYTVISESGGGWLGHVGGFERILKLRGPQSIQSPFAHALLHNIRQVSIMESFLKRRASFLAEEESMIAASGNGSMAVRVGKLALKVGVMVQEADALLAENVREEEYLLALLEKMVSLERDLQMWLVDLYRWSNGSLTPHRLVATSKYRNFHDNCGDLAYVVPESIEFPSLLSATSHNFVWICLLLLRQSIAEVARLSPYPLLRNCHQDAALIAAVDECATSLCKSIAYLISGNHGFGGVLACGGPLYFASQWYKHRSDTMRLKWCTHVVELLQGNVLLDESLTMSLDIQRPVFTWWMLPDIFAESDATSLRSAVSSETATPNTARRVAEQDEFANDEIATSDESD